MDRPLRYASTRLALKNLLADGSTGCVVSETDPHGPQIFVMLGQVMAAVSKSDGQRGLSLLSEQGLIAGPRLEALRRQILDLDDLVAEVSGQKMAALRLELLQFNLRSFCRIEGPAWFEPMAHVIGTGVLVGPLVDIEAWIHEPIQEPDLGGNTAQRNEPKTPAVTGLVEQSSPPQPVKSRMPSSSSFSQAELSFFEDQDRQRMRGDGEFTVQQEHLEVVDLGPPSSSPASPRGIRFANPDLNPDQLATKMAICNQVLDHVCQALTVRGIVAMPLLQALILEPDTDFRQRLPGVELDIQGHIMASSLEQALANRPSSEHRRRIEFGLLDLMERALDLCAEYLDDEGMDEVLNRVSGFHQRIQQ